MSNNNVRVIVTGNGWMGGGIGSADTAMSRLFMRVKNELLICAYSLTSGADSILQGVNDVLERGVSVTLIINRLSEQAFSVIDYLNCLLVNHPNLSVYDFCPITKGEDLHAKVMVADRTVALVGSFNLSRRGLLENHELGVEITGEAVKDIARAIDMIINSGLVKKVVL
ncbi:endonuclease [Desulfallas sp. Bu1-1]|uniref:phospholipase D-like domain-containing protein n=1 Tax=Desulfallas sp. Bu1-1 TaxID=2787620 RepID=UPI0018A1024F|nr:phospholipase D-like domain-containing protein [Desulfallas sp. Bu1-1]MBF7084353.1 endonuclease [Desulfallas sp. Bu1-1]